MMEKLIAKVEIDISAAAQNALNDFAREFQKAHGVTIQSIQFDWIHTMDGTATLVNSEMTTASKG